MVNLTKLIGKISGCAPFLILIFTYIIYFIWYCHHQKEIKAKFKGTGFEIIDEISGSRFVEKKRVIDEMYGNDKFKVEEDGDILFERLKFLDFQSDYLMDLRSISESVLLSLMVSYVVAESFGTVMTPVFVALLIFVELCVHFLLGDWIADIPRAKERYLYKYEKDKLSEMLNNFSEKETPCLMENAEVSMDVNGKNKSKPLKLKIESHIDVSF